MANTNAGQAGFGQLPTFGVEPVATTGNTAYPVADHPEGAIWAKGLGHVSATLGEWARQSFQAEAEQAGRIAGLDPNYRPDQAPLIQRAAFNRAALSTYQNGLEAKARQTANDAWGAYMDQPASQRDPQALVKTLDARRAELLKGDVFPEVQADFEKAWTSLRATYAKGAQDDHDKRQLDSAKAATLANLSAAGDTAHRAASIPGAAADGQIAAQIAAHDSLVDHAVDQDQFSAVQGQQVKEKFRQSVLQTRAMTVFDNLPDEQKPAALEKFKASYGGDYFAQLRAKESSGDDAARPATSSAQGRYQFTAATWAQLRADHPELGLTEGGRADADQQERAIRVFTAQNKTALEAAGREASPENLYLAHFMGAGGATEFLAKYAKTPGESAAAAFPQAAAANHSVFYKPDGSARSLAEVYDLQTKEFRGGQTAGLANDSYDWLAGKMQQSVDGLRHRGATAQRAALAEIGAAKRQIADGYDMPPAAWSQLEQQYGASPDESLRAAFAQASAVRGMLAGFKGQRPEAIEARVADMQAELARTGAGPAQVERVKDAETYLSTFRKDLAEDPTGRFARDYGAHVGALDLSSPAALAASLAARAPVAEQAQAAYGLPAPRYLLPADKAAFKSLAANGGPKMVEAAGAVMKALGPRGADVLREIGGDAPAFVTAARVAAWGGDAQFNADFAEYHRLASDPATRKALELPNRKTADVALNDALGHALVALPDLAASARTAATQVYEVRAFRNGWDKTLTDSAARGELSKAANQALGATYVGDVQYGGVASRSLGWFSSERLLAPGNMRADRVGDAVAALTDEDLRTIGASPLYDDNRPATMRAIAGSFLVSVGRGKYQVANTGPLQASATYLKNPDGGRFVLDLNAHEDRLRARLPGLYR